MSLGKHLYVITGLFVLCYAVYPRLETWVRWIRSGEARFSELTLKGMIILSAYLLLRYLRAPSDKDK
jgi:hypothetical protein